MALEVDVVVSSARLAESLGRSPRGNILLYGHPGTGKTAYCRHLAARIGRPLVMRRASDLLSMWVGQTTRGQEGSRSSRGQSLLRSLDACVLYLAPLRDFLLARGCHRHRAGTPVREDPRR